MAPAVPKMHCTRFRPPTTFDFCGKLLRMKKVIRRAIVLVFVATSCFAQDPARMDEVVQSYVRDKTFMGTVLVARGGDVVLSKGYGSANLEWNVPNSPVTKFRLGSLTKQFTAASILLLVERGKLMLEDPIRKYIPDAPAAWDKITIFNLLTHTSGIPSFTSLPEYKSLQLVEAPVAKTIATVRDKPLDFPPGEKMSYSNSGYLVLGYVIERVTGGSYAQFVTDNIFTPLGMKDSGYDSNTTIIPRRAAGYTPSAAGPINAGFIHMSIPHAAGALYSTTEDLLRWEQSLFGGKLISAASLAKMTTPFKNDYAFGLTVQTVSGRKVIHHGGGIDGFNTFLAYYPDTKVTIAVLANINGQAPGQIAAKLGDLAHGGTVQTTSERKEMPLPVATLSKYVGTYEVGPGINMMIRLVGDHLTTQLTGQQQIAMFAESETKFFLKVVDAQVEFFRDASGGVTHAVMYQNGRERKVNRTSGTVAEPPQHKETPLPASTLARYVGTYQMPGNAELSVTLDGNQLKAQLTGQPAFPIFAESETVFFYKVVEATLEFQKDASGAVTAVRLRQGPIDSVAPKKQED
jgi:CubicO group peptidase (beta-lactamase class C family)